MIQTDFRGRNFDVWIRTFPTFAQSPVMGDNTKIITLDAQILKLRGEIDDSPDRTSEAIAAKQRELDRLIASRYALLLKMQNRTSDMPRET